MAKPISVDDFAKRLDAALGGRLVSLLLYGSAARGTHVAGRSDVNTLLICDAADESLFAALGPVLRDWLRGGHPAPLILTAAEWRGSADVFPIEYEDIRAAHRHVAGRSDVNTLLICDAADESLFAALGPVLRDWLRGGHPAPLILTAAEWRGSADVFPIEYEDIRAAHRVLAGRDPWPGITVRRDDTRRQLEQELKGKLVRLRQAYAATREDGPALTR
ncbi:MAG: hypothetical protein DMD37_08220, partial [Gemmatimonadetes bacterium]